MYPSAESKAKFHRGGKALLRALAQELRLVPGTYQVRSCKGGPAVWGEVILHSQDIYLEVSGGSSIVHRGQVCDVMFRRCLGLMDYSVGPNQWMESGAIINDISAAAHHILKTLGMVEA